VFDIGDSFCFPDQTPTDNQRLCKSLNYKIEDGIFNHADVVAVTIGPILKKYAQIFPDNTSKISVESFEQRECNWKELF
jgi:hypothetical protein